MAILNPHFIWANITGDLRWKCSRWNPLKSSFNFLQNLRCTFIVGSLLQCSKNMETPQQLYKNRTWPNGQTSRTGTGQITVWKQVTHLVWDFEPEQIGQTRWTQTARSTKENRGSTGIFELECAHLGLNFADLLHWAILNFSPSHVPVHVCPLSLSLHGL